MKISGRQKLLIISSSIVSIVILLLFLNRLVNRPDRFIFLITLDTTRADSIDYSQSRNDISPNLAGLAHRGIHFTHAFSLIPITLPSHTVMFFSKSPGELSVRNNGDQVKQNVSGLIEILKKNGFSTSGVISLGVLHSEFGLNKGFDHYSESFDAGLFYKSGSKVNREVFRILEKQKGRKRFVWIHYSDPHAPYFPPKYTGGVFRLKLNGKEIYKCLSTDYRKIELSVPLKPGQNFLKIQTVLPNHFLFDKNVKFSSISLLDFKLRPEVSKSPCRIRIPNHWKKEISNETTNYTWGKLDGEIVIENESKEAMTRELSFVYRLKEQKISTPYLYKKSVRYLDKKLGELFRYLKQQGLYSKSTFIIAGDHGEGLGEFRGKIGHIDYLNPVFTHIPLIVFGKGVPGKGIQNLPVSLLDIAPTVLELAGIEQPDYMKGSSLFEIRGNRALFLETYAPEAPFDGFSMIQFPHQVIHYPSRAKAPWECYNLSDDRQGIRNIFNTFQYSAVFKKMKFRLLKYMKTIRWEKRANPRLSDDQKDMLKTLGYL